MKVLFFNYEYPPLGGGAGNATYFFMQEFSKIPNLEIDLVTSSIDENYHQEKIGNSITIHRLPIGKNAKNMHYQSQKELLIYSKEAWKFAKKLISEKEYDLTHSFFTVPCGYISLKLKKKYGIPYIVSLRGSDVPGYSERFTLIYKLLLPIIRKIWKKADFVISNSEGLKDLAEKSKPAKDIEIIYNGIDTNIFKPRPDLKNQDEIHIICGTRVTPRKGIRFLVKAMEPLVAKYPNIRLDIVGEGDEKKSLENLVQGLSLEKYIKFWGLIDPNTRSEKYAIADIYVSPSLNEGMSNFMLEALALGMPLVATDVGGTRELLSDGVNGFIIKTGETTDLEKKLEFLIENKNIREKMGQESRNRAEKMSWEKVAREYVDFYEEVRNLNKMKK